MLEFINFLSPLAETLHHKRLRSTTSKVEEYLFT